MEQQNWMKISLENGSDEAIDLLFPASLPPAAR